MQLTNETAKTIQVDEATSDLKVSMRARATATKNPGVQEAIGFRDLLGLVCLGLL